ncbi:MAG: carboxypeptidase regulatory-like domain-containing protein [Acidobacteriia bacterium]|nr:carboxypeptidase regulatory-like domain-containing protein [Terriglobia bacterium]
MVPATAQVSTGEVFGKATDGTGAVLPGVTVTLSGPALINPMVAVTTETGAYRFPRIPIGTYTVAFELTGFKKYVRSDIIIQAGFNAEVNTKLEISTVQETVTVTGESPVVDTKSTTIASSFTREALEKIPNARDPWVIIEQTPGMVMSGVNVGGNLSGQQTSFNAMGSGTNQQWNINGAVISDIASGNSSPTYYDFDSFEEIQVTTAGADASQQGAGVQVNFITRSGSNNLTGYGRFYDTNDKCFGELGNCQSINVTDDLRKQGVGGGNPIQDIRDMGAQLGGPIVKNKAWFWGAMSRQDVRVGVVGFYDTSKSGCQAIANSPNKLNADGSYANSIQSIKDCLFGDLTTLKNYNGRLQYQEATGHQSSFSYTYGDKFRSSRNCDAFHPLITCAQQTGPSIFYTGDHRWIVNNRLTIIGQYTHIHEDWFLGFEDPSLVDIQAINWVDIGGSTGYWDRSKSGAAYHTIRPQDDGRADGNYFASNFLGADHSIKFGFAFRRSPVESLSTVGGGAVARYRGIYTFAPGAYNTTLDTTAAGFATNKGACTINGVSYAAGTATGCDEADIQRDADFTYTLYQRDAYFQDSIKKGHATINLGLRYDHQHDIATPGTVPANRLLQAQLPAINFPGADSGVRYNNWSPRVGLTYDLRGDGKSIVKASVARYYGIGVFTAQALEPTGSTTTLRFPWKDLNGDKIVQANELQVYKADGKTLNLLNSPAGYDPANPGSPITTSIVDPNMKNDTTDEFILGFDHELMTNFGVGAMYIYRKYSNFCGSAQQGCVGNAVRYLDSTANYTGPVAFTAACGNSLCDQPSYTGFYFNGPTLHSNTIEENIGQYRTYQGLELTARKRLSNHWMMTSSYVYNHEKFYGLTPNLDYLDPTNRVPVDLIDGYEDGTRNAPHVFKLSGMYQLPYEITASANYNAHSNFPFNPTIVTGTRPNGLGTATISLTPANALRLPTAQTVDLNFDKSIRLGGPRRITLNMAIFNISNVNTALGQTVRQNTSTANYLTSIVGPRVLRFGARINF